MSFVARPIIPAPKASYVEGLRAKEREGKKTTARAAAAAAPKQPFKTALVLNGGGLMPVASAYGIFRGLYKCTKVGPNSDKKPVLDQFDVMAGVSGGYLASQMYCYANPEPTGFNNFDKPCSKLDPVNFLNTSANSDPTKITWDDLLTDNSKACGGKPEIGYYNWIVRQPGFFNPGVVSGIIMSLSFGLVAQILSFGKCVGRGCWPKYGWQCLPPFAVGFASVFRLFLFNFFLRPLGISQNKYTAAGPDQVSDVACAAGVNESEVAYPRPGAPTPMAHTQMIQVTGVGVGYRTFLGPLTKWAREVSKFVYDNDYSKGVAENGMGKGVYQALKLQPNYNNVSVVPYTFTPGHAITQYDPHDVSSTTGGLFPANQPMTFDRNLGTCCVDPPDVKFISNSQPSSTWVEKPSCSPCAPITSSGHLSPEAIMSLTADFLTQFQPEDFPAGPTGCLLRGVRSLPLPPAANVTYEFKTNALSPPDALSGPTRCYFSDGGVLESTGLAGTIAQGVSKAAVMINAFGLGGKGPWKKDAEETCAQKVGDIPLIGSKMPCAKPNPGGAPWTWTFDPYCGGNGYMGSSLASCFGVQPPKLGASEKYPVRPVYVLNHILDNNPETYDFRNLSIPEPKSYEDVRNVPWPPKPNFGGDKISPWEYLMQYMTYCQHAGQPLVCTLKGLKVLDNPFWGTTTAQDDVTLTVVWITLPVIWAPPLTAPPALPHTLCTPPPLLLLGERCAQESQPELAGVLAAARLRQLQDGKLPQRLQRRQPLRPHLRQLPVLLARAIGGRRRYPDRRVLVERASCPLRLPRRGDFIVNGDKGRRTANFTCLLE